MVILCINFICLVGCDLIVNNSHAVCAMRVIARYNMESIDICQIYIIIDRPGNSATFCLYEI